MRPDQIEKFRGLLEILAEVALEEGNPDNWSGAGEAMKSMSPETRGNRLWDKKNAATTFSIMQRTMSVIADYEDPFRHRDQVADESLNERAQRAQEDAVTLVAEVLKRSKFK